MGNYLMKTTKTYMLSGQDILEIREKNMIYRDPDNQLHVYIFDDGLAHVAIDDLRKCQSHGEKQTIRIDVFGQTIYGVAEHLSTNVSPGSRGFQVNN